MNILISGASSGIGEAIAKHLHQRGYNVIGTSCKPDALSTPCPFTILPLDVTSHISIQDCMQKIDAMGIEIDVLINNAGIGVCGAIEETSEALARQQFDVNFWGSVQLSRALLPGMRLRKSGKIIFISSLAGLIGVPFQGYYAASKHAIEGFAKSLRHEVKEFNISVSLIQPGFHRSDLHNRFQYGEKSDADYQESRQKALEVIYNAIEKAPSPANIVKLAEKIILQKKPGLSYRVGTDATWLPILQFLHYPLFEFGTRKNFKLPL